MMIMIFNLFCRIPIKFLKPKKKKKKTQHNKLTQKQEKHFKKKLSKNPFHTEREREKYAITLVKIHHVYVHVVYFHDELLLLRHLLHLRLLHLLLP